MSTDAVTVAVDKDKGSQYAIKWTLEHLLTRGQSLTLLHVNHISSHGHGHGHKPGHSPDPGRGHSPDTRHSPDHCHKHGHKHGHKQGHGHNHKHGHGHKHDHDHDQGHNHGHNHGRSQSPDHGPSHSQSPDHSHSHNHSHGHSNSGGSISISEATEKDATECKSQVDAQSRELFLPFRCFCTKKDIKCHEVLIEDSDISKALINYVNANSVEILVLGAPSRSGLLRFKMFDVPSTVSKGAPDFCTVYVIGKGKINYSRSATVSLPPKSPSRSLSQNQHSKVPERCETHFKRHHHHKASERTHSTPRSHLGNHNEIKSPFTRGKLSSNKSYELSLETDISYVSEGRPSTDHIFPPLYESLESGPRLSINTELDHGSPRPSYSGSKFIDMISARHDSLASSIESENLWSAHSHHTDDMEAEMRRLRLELKQTMDMYSAACREALMEKQKAMELNRWKLEEEHRLEEARLAQQAALAIAEKEREKCKAAIEAAEAAKRMAEMEAQKRRKAEFKAFKEAEERKKAQATTYDMRYRKYTIDEIEEATNNFSSIQKIGEGGYGPVYRGELDHTPVAIKILRPDAAQGRSQFQQEVQVLSRIRHPNMVLLLGACPDYGCLVYEYMSNGSLEDCLFRQGDTPVIPWQVRFRIAAEVGTGLLFLHQTKPEPLVHRDLKPGNILLDHNYVSKISDVGLARLVPPSVANSVTQYRMTSTAGTFCYIDPEYQQTGMLGIQSDIYSLGVMLLQLITAKPPMALTHHVSRAIETETFVEMLDPAVSDWPVDEALNFAKLALKCAEMRRKDRPNLAKVVLPELNRLRTLAEESMSAVMHGGGSGVFAPTHSSISTRQEVISDNQSGYASSRSRSSTSSADKNDSRI